MSFFFFVFISQLVNSDLNAFDLKFYDHVFIFINRFSLTYGFACGLHDLLYVHVCNMLAVKLFTLLVTFKKSINKTIYG